MRIERAWAMPNKWTFTIKPIKRLIQEEMADSRPWLDPFAGMTSPAQIKNDINLEMPTEYHEDALEFLKRQPDESVYGALFDAPYSFVMAQRKYPLISEGYKCTASFVSYIAKCKNELARLIEAGGKAICFGWNSNGLGPGRGFELQRIMLICHGGSHPNDTIVTVERKVQATLEGAGE